MNKINFQFNELKIQNEIDPKKFSIFIGLMKEKKLLLGFLKDLFEYLEMPNPIQLNYEQSLINENEEVNDFIFEVKTNCLEVCVDFKDQSKMRVILQIGKEHEISKYLEFYVNKLFTSQFKLGLSHADDVIFPTMVIGIFTDTISEINNLSRINNESMVQCFSYHDRKNKADIPYDKTSIVTFKLQNLDHYFQECGKKTGLGYWAAFLRNNEEDRVYASEYPLTKEAKEAREVLENKNS